MLKITKARPKIGSSCPGRRVGRVWPDRFSAGGCRSLKPTQRLSNPPTQSHENNRKYRSQARPQNRHRNGFDPGVPVPVYFSHGPSTRCSKLWVSVWADFGSGFQKSGLRLHLVGLDSLQVVRVHSEGVGAKIERSIVGPKHSLGPAFPAALGASGGSGPK